MKVSQDLVVFITGGASGLGLATVRRLHQQGAQLAVADLNEEGLHQLKQELKDRIWVTKCNVAKEEEVQQAMEGAVEEFGTIHVAIANAGIMAATPTLTSKGAGLNVQAYRKVMDVNYFG